MGLKASFENLKTQSTATLGRTLLESDLGTAVKEFTTLKSDTQKQIFISLIYCFTKTALIDREFSEEERQEVAKRTSRFLNLPQESLVLLIQTAAKELLSSKGRQSDFVATPFIFLSKKTNEKTLRKIYRYLTEVVASDDQVAQEEEYLLRLAGLAFGLTDKEVREYLLATELKTDLEDVQAYDPNKDSFAPENGGQAPVIKIDFD